MKEALSYQTRLTSQEKKWIVTRRVTRLSDGKEVLIYPMGAERYLSSVLFGTKINRYPIKTDVIDKNILVIPGYGNSSFLFAKAGASSVTVYDKDPVTIAWMKAFKKYYHFREYNQQGKPYPSIGELLNALTRWYPPLLTLPSQKFSNGLFWILNPKLLRRAYIHYMLSLARHAIQSPNKTSFELEKNVQFYTGELHHLIKHQKNTLFDTAFVPYLLGVRQGIEDEKDIAEFIHKLANIVVPTGPILVNPARNTKEFYLIGQRYFTTTCYENIRFIPGLEQYQQEEDKYWFRTQGLAVFRNIIF